MENIYPVINSLMHVILAFVIFAAGKFIYGRFTPYPMDEQLTAEDNLAVAFAIGGFYAGLFIILGAVLVPAPPGTASGVEASLPFSTTIWDAIVFVCYAIVGLIALIISLAFNNRFMLRRLDVPEELVTDKNKGAGIVIMSSNIASALFIAGVVRADSGINLTPAVEATGLPVYLGELLIGLAFSFVVFLAGQLALFFFSFISEKTVSYDVQYELEEKDNVAAGIAFGGCILAIGILLLKVELLLTTGALNVRDTLSLCFVVLVLFTLGPLVRLFVDRILLPGAALSREVTEDQNSGAGIIEAIVQIGFAMIVYFGI